jgi:predicted HicB family RNase H-like nuclease
MTYKGYEAVVKLDEEAGVFTGEVINTRDVITFEGASFDALRQAFEDSVEDYLEFCATRNEDPEKPFSGNFVIRMRPALHKNLMLRAKRKGKSLNSFVVECLEHSVSESIANAAGC